MSSAEETFTAFGSASGDSLGRLAWLLTGDRDAAAELLQASLVKLFRAYQVGRGWLPATTIPAGGEVLVLKASVDGSVVVAVGSAAGTFVGPTVFASTDAGATFVDRGAVPASWLDTPLDLSVGPGVLAASLNGVWVRTTAGWQQAAVPLPTNESVLYWGPVVSSGSAIEVALTVCPPGVHAEDANVGTQCGTRVARSTDQGGHFTLSNRIPFTTDVTADGVGSWWATSGSTLYRLRNSATWTSTPFVAPSAPPRLTPTSASDATMVWDPCLADERTCTRPMPLWATFDGGRTWQHVREG